MQQGNMMKLSELLENVEIIDIKGDPDVSVTGVTDDSRVVENGFAFVCMPDEYNSPNAYWSYTTDGHNYISDAVERRAAAVLVQKPINEIQVDNVTVIQVSDTRLALSRIADRFYNNPSGKLLMIGITGTNGKTSTCFMTRSIFQAAGKDIGILGTIIQRSGGADINAGMTTPEAHKIHKMLKDAVDEDLYGIVMEVSSHALELKRVDDIKFDVAAFTNLSQDHLDFHKGMNGYLASKLRLFEELLNKSESPVAVVNLDDSASEKIIKNTGARVITYGLHKQADVQVTDFISTVNGLGFTVRLMGKDEVKINLRVLGEYNLYNALAALAIGFSQGISLEAIKSGLENFKTVPGRFETVNCGQDFAVVVDYAHSPDALENVLKAAKKLTGEKLITVFGCGGDRDKGKRPLMGSVAAELSDYSVITSDNPRSEDPLEIISQIQAGIDSKFENCYEIIPDRQKAIGKAINMARKGDIIVIAGKGHENYQILKGGKRIHFDDREIAREFIFK
ncbi:UDP-N-acetylmuramoyl-L-alanyl-D-glutamate--2,6-diaminopimelate ligase [Candidatus Poribacteria bacterium]|nr:UDP-N-acetylmuramoyl-L-alanyl-D-glutamate--2,6-diaminopimelate ligase [Candidatus Poribacteria bacterium]